MAYLIAGYRCSSIPYKGMVVSKDCIVILYGTLYNHKSSAVKHVKKHYDLFKSLAGKLGCKAIVVIKLSDSMLYYRIVEVIDDE